jgi:peptide subunit release factor RF-3
MISKEYTTYGNKTLIYLVNRKTYRRNNLLMYKIQNWKNNRTKPADTLREELELIDEVYPKFDRQDYLDGKLQPVFLVPH